MSQSIGDQFSAPNQSKPHARTASTDPWQPLSVRIKRIVPETPGVKTYDLELAGEDSERFGTFTAGQFNMLYVPGVGEAAISISGRPDADTIRHTVRDVGLVTHALDQGEIGMSLGLRGPFGSAWPMKDIFQHSPSAHIVVVAGGIGLAPLRYAVKQFIQQRSRLERCDLLVGARTPEDLLYQGEYKAWCDAGVTVQTTVDRSDPDWHGNVGVATLLLDRLNLPNPESTILLTCGPEVMMRYVIQAAIQKGIPEQQLWLTLERNMNCAIGLCGHCQLGPAFVCKDGPVFRYDQIETLLHFQDL